MYLPPCRFNSYTLEYGSLAQQVPELVLENNTPFDYFGMQNPPSTPVVGIDDRNSAVLQKDVEVQTEQIAGSSVPSFHFYIGIPNNGVLGTSVPSQTPQPPQPQPQPQPAATGLLPAGLTTSGVLPLPPLPASITNPNGPEGSTNNSKLCQWWRGNSNAERSYICYGIALCAFVVAIITLAVVPTVLNKKIK